VRQTSTKLELKLMSGPSGLPFSSSVGALKFFFIANPPAFPACDPVKSILVIMPAAETSPLAIEDEIIPFWLSPTKPPMSREPPPTVTFAVLVVAEPVTVPLFVPTKPPNSVSFPDDDTAPLAVDDEIMPLFVPASPPTKIEPAPTVTLALLVVEEPVTALRSLLPTRPPTKLTAPNEDKRGDAWLAGMEDFAREMESMRPTARMRLHFALAKAHDDLGDFGLAFHHMKEANALKRAQIAYDEAASLELFDRIRETFDATLIAAKSGGGDPDASPIFILGMPRSGSTLVEQILASHLLVHGAGELPHLGEIVGGLRAQADPALAFPEIAQATDLQDFATVGHQYATRLRQHSATAARITDKMPSNFCFVGLIHLALPNARIIHVTRDPLDTCLSCFSRLFSAEQNHTYDLAELGRFYRKYAELMAHWLRVLPEGRMLELRYEDVVGDLEGSARRMIAYCGLDWSESCLAFHETNRPVKTASASQVRRPIYKTAQNRSRHYHKHLAPLIAELGDLAEPAS
jgi:hypothetical protein